MGSPGDLRCNFCGKLVRESSWRTDACECGCRAFYASRATLPERFAFATGLWRRVDLSKLMAVTAPLGGPVEPFSKKWEEINASLREQNNGKPSPRLAESGPSGGGEDHGDGGNGGGADVE